MSLLENGHEIVVHVHNWRSKFVRTVDLRSVCETIKFVTQALNGKY